MKRARRCLAREMALPFILVSEMTTTQFESMVSRSISDSRSSALYLKSKRQALQAGR